MRRSVFELSLIHILVTGDENLISLAGRSLFQMITGGEQRKYGNDTEENGK